MPRSNSELATAMGMRMYARRVELKLTQEVVAELAGITHQQYNKAENGKTCLGSDSLRKVSAALKISSDYLLTGKCTEEKYPEVISLLDGLTNNQIEMVQQVLKCMVQFCDKTEKQCN